MLKPWEFLGIIGNMDDIYLINWEFISILEIIGNIRMGSLLGILGRLDDIYLINSQVSNFLASIWGSKNEATPI